jgi:hypothetical protein
VYPAEDDISMLFLLTLTENAVIFIKLRKIISLSFCEKWDIGSDLADVSGYPVL